MSDCEVGMEEYLYAKPVDRVTNNHIDEYIVSTGYPTEVFLNGEWVWGEIISVRSSTNKETNEPIISVNIQTHEGVIRINDYFSKDRIKVRIGSKCESYYVVNALANEKTRKRARIAIELYESKIMTRKELCDFCEDLLKCEGVGS